jgi:type II secretion system protein C
VEENDLMQSLKSTSLKSIISLKGFIILAETALTIAIAWFAASFFWLLISGNTPLPQATNTISVASPQTARSLNNNFDTLTQFDPFNRTITAPSTPKAQDAAPETSLDLKLFGVRQSFDEKADGSAIIRTPDQKEYVFTVDDEIIDGVTLSAIYATHVEITRAGLRESLYLDGVDPSRIQGSNAQNNNQRATNRTAAPAPRLIKENGGTIRRSQIDAFVKSVRVRPRRRGRFIDGWVINADSNPVDLLALGLKPNDIFLSVNDTPVTTLEIMTELVSEIGNASTLKIRVERNGEVKQLTFDYLPTQ